MRLFLALANSPNPTFASNLWKANLHDPLVEMGHEVVLWDGGIIELFDLDPAASSTAPVRADFSERFVRAVEQAHRERPLDLVLTYLSDSHLEPSAIDGVREGVAPTLNFSCNNIHQFHLVRRISPHFTACLVPEREAIGSYRSVGAHPVFFPMAANPSVYRPLDVPVTFDVSFAGQRYGDRTRAILELREAGVDAHAFGQGWRPDGGAGRPGTPRGGMLHDVARLAHGWLTGRSPVQAIRDRMTWRRLAARHAAALHDPVPDEAYVSLFSRSRISLGFLVVGDTHRTRRPLRQVRLREFEAPMSGAFYMTEWFEELAEHYEIGREIVCYRSREELIDLCRHYLAHEAERDRIRRSGHERARRDHTWRVRFERLFTELRRLGVLPPGS